MLLFKTASEPSISFELASAYPTKNILQFIVCSSKWGLGSLCYQITRKFYWSRRVTDWVYGFKWTSLQIPTGLNFHKPDSLRETQIIPICLQEDRSTLRSNDCLPFKSTFYQSLFPLRAFGQDIVRSETKIRILIALPNKISDCSWPTCDLCTASLN